MKAAHTDATLGDTFRRAQVQDAVSTGRRERITYLDAAKGIGILLVVLGHCLGGLHDAKLVHEDSFAWLVFYAIYCFHMPLFFFLTGSLVESRIMTRPRRFLTTNLTRIAYPYFLWGTVQTIVLILVAGLANHPQSSSPTHAVFRLLVTPQGQFWFLYALFFLHLAALITLRIGGRLLLVTTMAILYGACVVWTQVDHFLMLRVSGTNILFYLLGVCVGGPLIGCQVNVRKPYTWCAIGALLFLASMWDGWSTNAGWYSYVTLPAAFAGTASILFICRAGFLGSSKVLCELGRRSMSIYVLHVMFLAGLRIVLQKELHISNVALILPLIFLCGVIGPLFVDTIVRKLRLQPALGLG